MHDRICVTYLQAFIYYEISINDDNATGSTIFQWMPLMHVGAATGEIYGVYQANPSLLSF